MGDFILDFREAGARWQTASRAATLLKFCSDSRVESIERDAFTLVMSRVDRADLWGPYSTNTPRGELLVALAGRVAFDECEWKAAESVEGQGGLASKAIFSLYQRGGVGALDQLNGNFAVLIHDAAAGRFHIVTDRCGVLPCYAFEPANSPPIIGTHPDVIATLADEEQNRDETSLAEFLTTGRLTFPFTYYRNIRALETGAVHSLEIRNGQAGPRSVRPIFHFNFQVDPRRSEQDLAEELGAAFRKAVGRRSTGRFGPAAVGLSGGLDSRVILSTASSLEQVRAFNLFDEENTEFRTAKSLADAVGVQWTPIQRDFDYYGNTFEAGVRISGGTGNIASNHFLGIRDRFAAWGVQSLLTGCYCDYVFKGLALNKRERPLSRTEDLQPFGFQFYHRSFSLNSRHQDLVVDRLCTRFPESSKRELSPDDWLNIEQKRTFPLAYEGDLAQRVIPQRVMPWYVPIVDNDIIDVYLKIPSRYKLNSSLFRKLALSVGHPLISAVPDSNTGATLNASKAGYSIHRYLSALQNRITDRLMPRMATRGSWPNWQYYVRHSSVIRTLWTRQSEASRDLFVRITGTDPFARSIESYCGPDLEYFLRLLTQKLWLEQRTGTKSPAPARAVHSNAI